MLDCRSLHDTCEAAHCTTDASVPSSRPGSVSFHKAVVVLCCGPDASAVDSTTDFQCCDGFLTFAKSLVVDDQRSGDSRGADRSLSLDSVPILSSVGVAGCAFRLARYKAEVHLSLRKSRSERRTHSGLTAHRPCDFIFLKFNIPNHHVGQYLLRFFDN